ncbi:MAG: hypothetical protein ACKVOK_09335 [Flavobacteriales bacterium]
MSEENNAHIDQYFREHFEELEVGYNAAHWNQLTVALAVASAAGVSQTPRSRIVRILKTYQNAFVIGASAFVLAAISLYFLARSEEASENPSVITPQILPSLSETSVDSIAGHSTRSAIDSLRNNSVANPYKVDSLIPTPTLVADSIDSLKVDSLKGFLFW